MAAQLGADARQQHLELEGLGHIVVRAGVQALDGVRIARGGGQHDDRRRQSALAHLPADLAPVEVGQVDVEKDEVGLQRDGLGHARGAVGGLGDGELLMQAELFGESLADIGIVIDDQNHLALRHGRKMHRQPRRRKAPKGTAIL